MENDKTAGQISLELMQKEADITDVRQIRNERNRDYIKKLEDCINKGLKSYQGDFYVVVASKRERLLPNIIRNFIFHRMSCPTPNYDQVVYQYKREKDEIKMLWTIPDKYTCEDMYSHAVEVPDSHKRLLKFVLDFYDNSLLKYAMKLNKEETLFDSSEKYIEEIYG